ncbi:MAG: DinB family protein [Acidobacteriota bacterium]|nr:DinB family protein [Acidobacteriota bacterium]
MERNHKRAVLNSNITPPDATEYAPYYAGYVSLVPEGDILTTLSRQLDESLGLLRGISKVKAESRYAPGKWSIKELVGHVTDAERVFGYRALRFARNDPTPLAGFEQDGYVANSAFNDCRLRELADEFQHVRCGNIQLFKNLGGEAWLRRGSASGHEVSVRALAYIIAGHELHHMTILRTKYL